MDIKEIAPLLAFILATISLLFAAFGWGVGWTKVKAKVDENTADIAKLYENDAKILNSLESISKELTILNTQIGPFWKLVENNLSDFLKHPHTPRMDSLLDAFKGNMQLEELNELRQFLDQELENYKQEGNISKGLVVMLGLSRIETRIRIALMQVKDGKNGNPILA